MKKQFFATILFLNLIAAPLVSFAADTASADDPCNTGVASPVAAIFKVHFCSVNDALLAAAQLLLSIIALASVVFIMVGGYRYIFSAGNEEQAQKGRDTLVNAIIGLVITVFAYAIITIVTGTIKSNINPANTPGSGSQSSATGSSGSSGATGSSSNDPKLQTIVDALNLSAVASGNNQYTYTLKANGLYSDLISLCPSIQGPSGARVTGFVITIQHHVKLPDIPGPNGQPIIGPYVDSTSTVNMPTQPVVIIGNAFAFVIKALGSAPTLAGEDNSQISISGNLNLEGGAASCPIMLQKSTTASAITH